MAGQIDGGGGDVVRGAELLGRDVLLDVLTVCFSFSASVMGVVMKPGAMQLAVMPREATSRASDFDHADHAGLGGGIVALAGVADDAADARRC